MNPSLNEQIAPEIVQAIIAQASAHGLSINDYLRDLLGLTGGEHQELAIVEEPQPRNEEMLVIIRRGRERLRGMPTRGSTEETAPGAERHSAIEEVYDRGAGGPALSVLTAED